MTKNSARRVQMVWVAVFLCRALLAQTTWFVATNGNDTSHTGTNGWTDAFFTITNAVAMAAGDEGDTILVGPGEYVLTAGISNSNKTIHLLGVAGPEQTIVNGNFPARNIRPLWMGAGRVGGFTFTNGIHNALGNFGGGVYLTNAVMTNCIITGCMPRRYGGGVAVMGGAILSNCTVRGNRLEWVWGGGAGCQGGGVFISGGAVWNCIIANNSSENVSGGCHMPSGAGGLLANSLVSNNTAATNAGGVGIYTNCVVSNSLICNNTVLSTTYSGAGVYMYRGGRIANCLLAGNQAPNGMGGGLYINQNGEIDSCTIAGNSANSGGGVYAIAATAGYDIYVCNTIIYSNSATDGNNNWVRAGDHTWFTNCCATPSVADYGSGNTDLYPGFVNPAAADYHLASDSPCINAGLNQAWMVNARDLDGRRRLDWGGGPVDIGCYEYVPCGTMFRFK